MMAGPCSVEGEEMLLEVARHVARQGAKVLRGGAFKPRTSPYSFQGLGEAALKMMATARDETGLKVVTEVVAPGDVELVARYADILQLGTRNMQNYALLQEAGRSGKPVLLKRGMSSTIEEWLLAAEYVLSQGNRDVILCERGIRTFETATRFTLDLNAVPLTRELSHLPVIVDPSQATGRCSLVRPMTLRKALERGIVASASSDGSVAGMADVIVIGAPIRAMRDVFAQLAGRTNGKVVTDMASTKVAVMEWAAAAGVDLVGGHPMCGKETWGVDAADASLFKDAPWVLTRTEPVLIDLMEAVGAHPIVMDAETHDRLVAGVSHAAFLLSVGYVLALSRRPDWPEASKLAAGGFRDMSRLAAGDPELFPGGGRTHRAQLVEQPDAITAELARLRRPPEGDDARPGALFE